MRLHVIKSTGFMMGEACIFVCMTSNNVDHKGQLIFWSFFQKQPNSQTGANPNGFVAIIISGDITKNNNSRYIPLNNEAMNIMNQLYKKSASQEAHLPHQIK